jgi:hypothetical protein
MNLQEFETLLREIFPVGSTHTSVEFVSASIREGKEPVLIMTLRLIGFEDGSIRDIKEQELFVGPEGILEWYQLEIYFRGYAAALRQIVDNIYPSKSSYCMPSDFFPRSFELKKATTADDYCQAFLLKSRLGKLLV